MTTRFWMQGDGFRAVRSQLACSFRKLSQAIRSSMASTCINLNISLVIAVLMLVPMQLHQFFGLYFNKAQTVLADSDGDAFTWTPDCLNWCRMFLSRLQRSRLQMLWKQLAIKGGPPVAWLNLCTTAAAPESCLNQPGFQVLLDQGRNSACERVE